MRASGSKTSLPGGADALEFLEGKTQQDYLADKGLRAMVERKLFVVGEAMSQLRSQFPEVAQDLPDVREIVGFRNVLAHGYFALDHRPRMPDSRVLDLGRATPSLAPNL